MQNVQTDSAATTTNSVDAFMKQLNLDQYTEALKNLGYDDLVVLKALPKTELENVTKLAKMKPGHAAKFTWALAKTNDSKDNVPEATTGAAASCPASTSVFQATGSFLKRLFTGQIFQKNSKENQVSAPGSYVAMVVDRSGSMSSMGNEVMNGFNTFLAEQQALPGKCTATVVRFDDKVEVIQHGVPLQSVRKADRTTFAPRGMTALLDAMGQTIQMVETQVDSMDQKPDKIMVMILTDGAENASRSFTRAAVMATIKRLEATGDWQFVFVGANQDAIAVGESYGMSAKNCLSYSATPNYQNETFKCMSANVAAYRSASKSMYGGFTPAQRSATYR